MYTYGPPNSYFIFMEEAISHRIHSRANPGVVTGDALLPKWMRGRQPLKKFQDVE
jgi:hypothetical protein